MSKTRNERRKQWKRWARKEIRAGRTIHNGYGPFIGYHRHCYKWATRGNWRPRFYRRWGWLFQEDPEV